MAVEEGIVVVGQVGVVCTSVSLAVLAGGPGARVWNLGLALGTAARVATDA